MHCKCSDASASSLVPSLRFTRAPATVWDPCQLPNATSPFPLKTACPFAPGPGVRCPDGIVMQCTHNAHTLRSFQSFAVTSHCSGASGGGEGEQAAAAAL
ncbi:hypothetical protein TYRP_002139 [Tyrophagus putrescentiae]|nr:hypothetical protein TYRP_002139 [Tyrophagus putrescentiae]